MRRVVALIILSVCFNMASAQQPMYVVGGRVVDSIEDIPHENIERIDVLPADDETIAQWGLGASEGVIIVTLRYDTPASFAAEGYNNFTDYLAHTVKWSDNNPAERVSLRLHIEASGRATISEVLQATSRNYLKRVERAIAEAPLWSPAMRDGVAVESIQLVNLQLPEGKSIPLEPAVIIR
jgi:hypothetical protein